MVGRDGAFGILIGAAVGTLFHVPAHGSAQDSLSVSCVDVNLLSPSKDLTRCAEQAKAHYVLALRYAAGVGVPEDDAEAFRWYRLAAEEGHAEAQSVLGFKYANGVDVPEDDAEAARWYRLAAEQGNTAAQFNLGLMYYNGEGVPEGDAEAARWYRLAAEQGDATARANLGNIYARGESVPQDLVYAYLWLNLSAAQGNDDARRNKERVMELMTHEELAEAQRLSGGPSREWIEMHPKDGGS